MFTDRLTPSQVRTAFWAAFVIDVASWTLLLWWLL
jgi:hypothetical protein